MFFEPHSRRYFKYDAATQTHMEVSEDGQPLMRKCKVGNFIPTLSEPASFLGLCSKISTFQKILTW